MGKQLIKTTNYFSHDSNARNDEKLVKVRMEHGAEGYGVYFMILERLREERGYMSAKDYNMIGFDLRVDAALVKAVVEDYGLFAFTDDGKRFYSESFNNRMEAKDTLSQRRSEAGKKGNEKRWGKSDGTKQIQIEPTMPQTTPITQTADNDECLKRFFGNRGNQIGRASCRDRV